MLVIRFGTVPVQLVGPAVWCYACWSPAQHGPGRWLEAPHLEPVRQTALHRAQLAGVIG